MLNPFKLMELNKQLATINEEIQELISCRGMILSSLNCSNADELKVIVGDINTYQHDLERLEKLKEKLSIKKDSELELFKSVQKDIHESKAIEIQDKRMELRPQKLKALKSRLKEIFADSFESSYFKLAIEDIDKSLGEKSDDYDKTTLVGQLRRKGTKDKTRKKDTNRDMER